MWKFNLLDARRLSDEALANEFDNCGLSWILGYDLSSSEARKFLDQN
jgi:hypothetical protein